MKKIFFAVVSIVLLISLCGCDTVVSVLKKNKIVTAESDETLVSDAETVSPSPFSQTPTSTLSPAPESVVYDDTGRVTRLYELGYIFTEDATDETAFAQARMHFMNINSCSEQDFDSILFSENAQHAVYTYGDELVIVAEYKKLLTDKCYFFGAINEKYNKTIQEAVLHFQKRNGLTESGEIDMETAFLLKSGDAKENLLKEKSNGRDVKAIEEMLCSLGYLKEKNVDINYGAATVKAVEGFQKDNSLKVTGNCNAKTIRALKLAAGALSTYPEDTPQPTKSPTPTVTSTSRPSNTQKPSPTPRSSATPKPTPTPIPRPKATVAKVIEIALSKMGCPYKLGGKGPNEFDCSGFVYYCFRTAGVDINYKTSHAWFYCTDYERIYKTDELKKGDVIGYDGHVGIILSKESFHYKDSAKKIELKDLISFIDSHPDVEVPSSWRLLNWEKQEYIDNGEEPPRYKIPDDYKEYDYYYSEVDGFGSGGQYDSEYRYDDYDDNLGKHIFNTEKGLVGGVHIYVIDAAHRPDGEGIGYCSWYWNESNFLKYGYIPLYSDTSKNSLPSDLRAHRVLYH